MSSKDPALTFKPPYVTLSVVSIRSTIILLSNFFEERVFVVSDECRNSSSGQDRAYQTLA